MWVVGPGEQAGVDSTQVEQPLGSGAARGKHENGGLEVSLRTDHRRWRGHGPSCPITAR